MKKLKENIEVVGEVHGSLEQHAKLFNDIHNQFIANGGKEIKTEGSYADINKPQINLKNASKILEKRKSMLKEVESDSNNIKYKP